MAPDGSATRYVAIRNLSIDLCFSGFQNLVAFLGAISWVNKSRQYDYLGHTQN